VIHSKLNLRHVTTLKQVHLILFWENSYGLLENVLCVVLEVSEGLCGHDGVVGGSWWKDVNSPVTPAGGGEVTVQIGLCAGIAEGAEMHANWGPFLPKFRRSSALKVTVRTNISYNFYTFHPTAFKLSLCLTKHNAMKTYWGVELQLHALWTRR
jgi:hypothetical protein